VQQLRPLFKPVEPKRNTWGQDSGGVDNAGDIADIVRLSAAKRLASRHAQPILRRPGQRTVITCKVCLTRPARASHRSVR
jgi:hypothetical protein